MILRLPFSQLPTTMLASVASAAATIKGAAAIKTLIDADGGNRMPHWKRAGHWAWIGGWGWWQGWGWRCLPPPLAWGC